MWGDRQIADVVRKVVYSIPFFVHFRLQIERDADVIRLDQDNTVKSLRDQLQLLLQSNGNDDAGFPILKVDEHNADLTRLVGVIGARELEHALCM